MSRYRVAPIFLIRMAGVPFDSLEDLATPNSSRLARELIAGKAERTRTAGEASKVIESRERLLSPEVYHALRIGVRALQVPRLIAGEQPAVYTNYSAAATMVADLELRLGAMLAQEVASARAALIDASRRYLPDYLVFAAEGVRNLVARELAAYPAANEPLPARNNPARKLEQTLLLYLQRIAAKNDTFSRFGPAGWGAAKRDIDGFNIAPEPGIARTEAFVERWAANALAAFLTAQGTHTEVPTLEPHAFAVLRDDVERWPPGAARDSWLPLLDGLCELPQRFTRATAATERQLLLEEARIRLQNFSIAPPRGERFLYTAGNPIGEECYRETHCEIAEQLIDEVAVEAEPWIDLWRDSYAFVASRVAAGLRQVFTGAAPADGAIPLPTFLRICEEAKLSLTGPGLVVLAAIAFQEVKAAVAARLQPHLDDAEYELTREDCHVVRNTFEYPPFDEYTYPSADLQLSAESTDAIRRGDYQWIIGELHPPVALLHHGFYWSCPDHATLNAALASTACGKPTLHYGFGAADLSSHTSVHLFDALPELMWFVSPQRGNPKWRSVPPAEAEVYIDAETQDVCIRRAGGGEHLGSFARGWLIPLGFHPFAFTTAPHTPRLRCGNVVVQRRTWTIAQEEFGSGTFSGISPALVIAVEELRARRGLPRHIFIRPTERALRRSGAVGRDKDTKPVFVDLESYLSIEIFHRWLTKSGELDVTEMLPDPQHLCWQEPDGRRTFELRTQIVPRS